MGRMTVLIDGKKYSVEATDPDVVRGLSDGSYKPVPDKVSAETFFPVTRTGQEQKPLPAPLDRATAEDIQWASAWPDMKAPAAARLAGSPTGTAFGTAAVDTATMGLLPYVGAAGSAAAESLVPPDMRVGYYPHIPGEESDPRMQSVLNEGRRRAMAPFEERAGRRAAEWAAGDQAAMAQSPPAAMAGALVGAAASAYAPGLRALPPAAVGGVSATTHALPRAQSAEELAATGFMGAGLGAGMGAGFDATRGLASPVARAAARMGVGAGGGALGALAAGGGASDALGAAAAGAALPAAQAGGQAARAGISRLGEALPAAGARLAVYGAGLTPEAVIQTGRLGGVEEFANQLRSPGTPLYREHYAPSADVGDALGQSNPGNVRYFSNPADATPGLPVEQRQGAGPSVLAQRTMGGVQKAAERERDTMQKLRRQQVNEAEVLRMAMDASQTPQVEALAGMGVATGPYRHAYSPDMGQVVGATAAAGGRLAGSTEAADLGAAQASAEQVARDRRAYPRDRIHAPGPGVLEDGRWTNPIAEQPPRSVEVPRMAVEPPPEGQLLDPDTGAVTGPWNGRMPPPSLELDPALSFGHPFMRHAAESIGPLRLDPRFSGERPTAPAQSGNVPEMDYVRTGLPVDYPRSVTFPTMYAARQRADAHISDWALSPDKAPPKPTQDVLKARANAMRSEETSKMERLRTLEPWLNERSQDPQAVQAAFENRILDRLSQDSITQGLERLRPGASIPAAATGDYRAMGQRWAAMDLVARSAELRNAMDMAGGAGPSIAARSPGRFMLAEGLGAGGGLRSIARSVSRGLMRAPEVAQEAVTPFQDLGRAGMDALGIDQLTLDPAVRRAIMLAVIRQAGQREDQPKAPDSTP